VTNLTGWEFKLYYLNSIVNCTGILEGPFLKQGGSTFPIFNTVNDFNETHGRILAACTLLGQEVSASGNGTLARITFIAGSGGQTPLHLADTKLGDEQIPPQPIPHTTTMGIVNVGAIRDLAVINFTMAKSIIGQGYTLTVNVTVENQGGLDETFNVTLYANATTIETYTVIELPPMTPTTLIFIWNTAGWPMGNYSISAYAWPIPGETDTSDNTGIGGWIFVTITGDVDGDRDVDIFDIVNIASGYGTQEGDPQYKTDCDIDGDGDIDIFDIVAAATNYGQSLP
jgi:hypothetical protein